MQRSELYLRDIGCEGWYLSNEGSNGCTTAVAAGQLQGEGVAYSMLIAIVPYLTISDWPSGHLGKCEVGMLVPTR